MTFDLHTFITQVQSLIFKVKCMNFGHRFEKLGDDKVRCPWCGRVYYMEPGEFE